jgi:hypothetical protein
VIASLGQSLPQELEWVRQAALKELGPLRSASPGIGGETNFIFGGHRSDAGRKLPEYFLVYFLLVDLLGFHDLGQWEKVSWSIPVEYCGKYFLIDYRKFGVGIFINNPDEDEDIAEQVTTRIQKAIKKAQPFFEWLARRAVDDSSVNLRNNSLSLFQRFQYLRELYYSKIYEEIERKDEQLVTFCQDEEGEILEVIKFPKFRLRKEASWIAISVIEAFFSWTEHIFIHLALLAGKIESANEVADLAADNWPNKFKAAIDISDAKNKRLYDDLKQVREQLRNHVAHGSFGKDGEAFDFHSATGSVPVMLPHCAKNKKILLRHGLEFDTEHAITIIDDFNAHIWTGANAPAKIYIQGSILPIIMPLIKTGVYAEAMLSVENMTSFVEYLENLFDDAANMDW